MQHYLNLRKHEWGRHILALVLLLVCFCPGAGAWVQTYSFYYTPDGKKVTADTKKALKFTCVHDTKKYDSDNSTIDRIITACEPVRESDFLVKDDDYVDDDVYVIEPFEITQINSYVGYDDSNIPIVLPTIGIADAVFSTEFWRKALKGIKLPYKTRYLGKNFVDGNTYLDYVDFSGCDNLGKIIFDEDAFGSGNNYNGRHVIFKEGLVTYSICRGDMEVKSISTMLERMVLLGQKKVGNITGYLTSLGGQFKGYTAKDFSLAITDGMEGLEDGALQGSSVVAVSLPRSFDMLNSDGTDNKEVTCGSDVFTGCDKLKRIYVFHGGVPYCFIKNNDTNEFYGGYDTDAGDSNYQFIYSNDDLHKGLTNDLFAARMAQTKGAICIVPSVTYATGCTVGVRQNWLVKRYFSGNTAITSVKIINRKDGCSISNGLDESCFKDCTGLTDVDIEVPEKGSQGFVLSWDCFQGCTSLRNVKLGKYVTSLNGGCFDGCTALKNVEFEKDADCELYIVDGCFNGCTALTTLDLRDRKITGFDSEFKTSSGINTIYFYKNNGNEQLTYAWTTLNSLNLPKGKYNGTTTCDGMADGEKMVLLGVANASGTYDLSATGGKVSFTDSSDKEIVSATLGRVLDGTLTGYSYVELPYGVSFGTDCFNRSKLTHLGLYPTQGVHVTPTYPRDIATESGKELYMTVDRCDADVEHIVIPSEVVASNVDGVVMFVGDDRKGIADNLKKSLWNNAENTTLKSVTFADSNTVGDYVFTNAYAPTICGKAFISCKNLATVKFPTYAFDVDEYAFKDCASLTSVDLRHCRKLGYKAFYNCPSIGEVRFGDQLVKLDNDVFSGDEGKLNTTLKSIVMPQFTYINNGVWKPTYDAKAFSNLKNVKTVVIDPVKNPISSMDNHEASFDAWKTTLDVLKDNGLKVYVTAAVYEELSKKYPTFFEDYDVAAASDYRFMATADADGEALDKGYGTVCLEKAVDLDNSYNVKALYDASYDEAKGAVALSTVTKPVAGKPYVYARGNDDPSGLVVFGYGADDTTVDAPLTGGALVGTFSRIYAPQGSYVLQSDNLFHIVGSENKIGVGAHRAYLSAVTSGSSEARLSIIEDDQPTGINGVTDNADTDSADAPMYNLNGQRIAAPVKGQIYIVKGKKVIK